MLGTEYIITVAFLMLLPVGPSPGRGAGAVRGQKESKALQVAN
jgi:hypothetical protein